MKVEQLQAADAEKYCEKLDTLIKATISLPAPAIEHFTSQWTSERILALMDSWLFLIAKGEHNEIQGLILGTPPEGGVATIIWVLVDPSMHRKGIGAALFQGAVEIYKNQRVHKIKLTVPDKETTRFYEKLGMNVEGIHLNHWWNHDFWAMGYHLNKIK